MRCTYECVDMSRKVTQDRERDVDQEIRSATSDAIDADGRDCKVWLVCGLQSHELWTGKDVRKTVMMMRRIAEIMAAAVNFLKDNSNRYVVLRKVSPRTGR